MNKDWDKFMLAAYLGDADLCTLLYETEEERARILTKEDNNGDNYIIIAAKQGNTAFVKTMLARELIVHKNNRVLLQHTMERLDSLASKFEYVSGSLARLVKEKQEELGGSLKFPTKASVGSVARGQVIHQAPMWGCLLWLVLDLLLTILQQPPSGRYQEVMVVSFRAAWPVVLKL